MEQEEVPMSATEKKEKGKKEAKAEGPQSLAQMCGEMMSREMPDCCGPEMRTMMSRWMTAFQAGAKK